MLYNLYSVTSFCIKNCYIITNKHFQIYNLFFSKYFTINCHPLLIWLYNIIRINFFLYKNCLFEEIKLNRKMAIYFLIHWIVLNFKRISRSLLNHYLYDRATSPWNKKKPEKNADVPFVLFDMLKLRNRRERNLPSTFLNQTLFLWITFWITDQWNSLSIGGVQIGFWHFVVKRIIGVFSGSEMYFNLNSR